MTLTQQQLDAARGGGAVELTVDDETFVLLSKGIYDRVQQALFGDTDLTPDELRHSIARTFAGSGWDEPEMDAYDHYDEELKKRCP